MKHSFIFKRIFSSIIALVTAIAVTLFLKLIGLTWPTAIFLGVSSSYLFMFLTITDRLHPYRAKRLYKSHQVIGLILILVSLLGVVNYHQTWLLHNIAIIFTWPLALAGVMLFVSSLNKEQKNNP